MERNEMIMVFNFNANLISLSIRFAKSCGLSYLSCGFQFQATLIAAIPLFLCGVEASFAADWKNLFPNKTATLIEESLIGTPSIHRIVGIPTV